MQMVMKSRTLYCFEFERTVKNLNQFKHNSKSETFENFESSHKF